MKGASWADQTAEEEERRDHEQAQRQQQQQSQSQSAPRSSPTAARSNAPAPASYAGRAGGPNMAPSSQSQSQSGYRGGGGYGGSQDSRGAGGYGHQQRADYRGGAPSYGASGAGYNAPQQQQRGGAGGYGSNAGGYGGGARGGNDGQQWSRGEQPAGSPRDDRRGGGGGMGGGDYGRGGAGPRGGGMGGPRSQLKPSEDLSPDVEQGIVAQLKDASAFGFIKCADRDGEMFFHLSDVVGGAGIRRGDEVQFRVATDTRDGRSRALQVEVLPKGSVQFEQVVEQNVRGVITKEMVGQWKQDKRDRRPKASLADSLAQGRAEAYGGKIKRTTAATADAAAATPAEPATAAASTAAAPADGAATPAAADADAVYEFSERDLTDPNVVLYIGDVIEFDVFVERKSKRKGATKLRLIEPNPVGRERGRVVSIKDNFGFLQVEEELDEDGNEMTPPQQHTGRGYDRYQQQQKDQLFFHFSELMDPRRLPVVGDELSFRVDKSPAEGNKVSAQRIFMLPKGSLNSREVAKETSHGVITREIAYEAQPQPQQQQPQQAQAQAQQPATSPTASPTAPSTDVPASSPNPLARDAPAPASSSSSSSRRVPPKVIPGLISYTDASGATVELPFRPADLHVQGRSVPTLLKGDTASFHVLTIRTRSGVSRRATQVAVQPSGWSKVGREQGIVSSVKENFGFVDSVARSDKVFLHASQLRQPTAAEKKEENPRDRRPLMDLHVGMEVEFNAVQNEPGKWSATRVTVLPQGSVTFDELLPYIYTGVVARGIKVRDVAPAAPKDGSSFSKNDLRRDQAAAPGGGREGKGEKGEIKHLALAGESESPPADFVLPKDAVPFFDLDVIAPAAPNLDTTAFVVGDVVTLQLKRHKATKKLSGARVQLQQMQPGQREKGQVSRVKDNVGYLLTLTRAQPLAFFVKDAPRGANGERVQVGDCLEFNVSEANAGSKKERAQRGGGGGADDDAAKAFAVRLSPLPRGSVEVGESVDRTRKVRGFISVMPERPSTDNKGKPSGGKVGQVVVVQTEKPAVVPDAAKSHPASWQLDASAAWAVYSAAGIHAGSIAPESAKVEGEEKYPFTHKDLASVKSFLNQGDLVDFYLSVRSQPTVVKRPVEFSLVPLLATVERVDVDKADPKSYTGTVVVYNPQAKRSEETFIFSSKDFVAPANGAAAADSAPLIAGDHVEFRDIVLNPEHKKRQAKIIVRTTDTNRPSKIRPGTKRRADAPIVSVSRFARGPDKEGIGFAPRRSRVSASPVPTPSPTPSQ